MLFADFKARLEESKKHTSDTFIPAIAIHSPYSVHPILVKHVLDIAKKLIDVAVNAGVDAVKFQTFKAEKVVSKCCVSESSMPIRSWRYFQAREKMLSLLATSDQEGFTHGN